MIYAVSHTTKYSYENYVTFCHNIATLKPREFLGQKLLEYQLEISPKPFEVYDNLDFFGNIITRFSIQEPHKELIVTAKSKILVDETLKKRDYFSDQCQKITIEEAIDELKSIQPEILDARQFILESALINNVSSEIVAYAKVSFKPGVSVFKAAFELMQRIFTDFEFDSGFTNVATPINEVMKERKGVCQDFAQIAIACIRSIGLPARYVSGYIETIPPLGKVKLVGTDASHAWFSIFIPKVGWVDFDPTNNQIPKNQHITVSWGRDYYDVSPLKGVVYSSGKSDLEVSVDVRPA